MDHSFNNIYFLLEKNIYTLVLENMITREKIDPLDLIGPTWCVMQQMCDKAFKKIKIYQPLHYCVQ